jgi:UDP-glucose 4-epimerase
VTWLVTGGAGYIGAHTVHELVSAGEPVVVLDDLSDGVAARVPDGVPLVVAPVHERATVRATLRRYRVRGVIHLAARKSVAESVCRPGWYQAQNVGGLAALLASMADAGVGRIVFSSSAAVYGIAHGRVVETAPTRPVNPYGTTKLSGERLLRAEAAVTGLSWVALRYFNVAGCAAPGLADRGATNLIPLALRAVRTGAPLTVSGLDYPTRDGSGVRDYVDVRDVARAHVAALGYLAGGPARGRIFNVGTGRGASVLDVVRQLGAVAGRPVPYVPGPRRPGDPAETVADVRRIRRELGWTARHDLADSLACAWHAAQGASLPAAGALV